MRLDHFVIHIEPQEEAANQIASFTRPLGFPFDPIGNRNFDSFSTHFLYVGTEYLEIVQLKKPDESGWIPQWVERFKRGIRGIYCLFLETKNIDDLAHQFQKNGFDIKAERSAFIDVDGTQYPFPWKQIFMPPIPGTEVDISFIQYDHPPEQLREIYIPNSDENGLTGIQEAIFFLPNMFDKVDFIKQIFRDAEVDATGISIQLENGVLRFQEGKIGSLKLSVKSINSKSRVGFKVTNVEVQTV